MHTGPETPDRPPHYEPDPSLIAWDDRGSPVFGPDSELVIEELKVDE